MSERKTQTPATLMADRLDIREFLLKAPPPPDLVIPNLNAGIVGVLSAPGATAKTWWLLQMMCAVSARSVRSTDTLDLLDDQDYPERACLYICAEDGREVMWRRLHAIMQHLPQGSVDRLVANLHIVPLAGKGVDLTDDRWIDAAIAEARKIGAGLIVGETVSRLHKGDENDNGHMARFVGSLEAIAVETKAAVIVSTHQGKASVLGGRGDFAQAARGASSLIDNARWGAFLARMTPDEAKAHKIDDDLRKRLIRFGISKSNHGAIPADRWYSQESDGVLRPYPLPTLKPAKEKKTARNEIDVTEAINVPAI